MALHHADTIDIPLRAAQKGAPSRVYLLWGERYLCQRAAERLLDILLPDKQRRATNLATIDGEREDPAATLAALRSFSLFPGRKVFLVRDAKILQARTAAADVWQQAVASWDTGEPERAWRMLTQMTAPAGLAPGDLPALTPSAWKKALGFEKPADTAWLEKACRQMRGPAATPARPAGIADQYLAAFEEGAIPADHILVLLCDSVDKRRKLYKYIEKRGTAIDLSVAGGSNKAARGAQEKVLRGLMRQTLREFGKTMEPRAAAMLLERVGFHPVAVVRETEKLALFADGRDSITAADVETLIGRTREDALFEFTEAVADRRLEDSLVIAARLHAAGVHPLALVAGIRNILRRLLAARAVIAAAEPAFVPEMTFAAFQKGYLPEARERMPRLLSLLPPHPFALYMTLAKARNFTTDELSSAMGALLRAELAMKSTGLSGRVLLENFLLATVPRQKKRPRRTHLSK